MSLIPSFSLIINAPNAILNDLAGAPISVGKFSAYSDSNSDQGISLTIFTQRLSADNLPSKGSSKSDGGLGASSAFRYTSANGDARVLSHNTCFSCTLTTFLVGKSLHCLLFSLIQQALLSAAKTSNNLPHLRIVPIPKTRSQRLRKSRPPPAFQNPVFSIKINLRDR